MECSFSSECASDVCLPIGAGMRVCSVSCGADSDCGAGWSCDAFGGISGRVCVPDERAEREPTDPGPTDPEPTDPGPTDPPPTDPEPMIDPCLASVADASTQSTCALAMDGDLWCWGGVVWSSEDYDPGYYALGPEKVIEGEDIVDVSDGGLHLCALTSDGRLLCRGENRYGQLGVGHRTDAVAVEEVPGDWAQVSTGYIHTCGIQTDGSLWCWGFGNDGALGIGDYDDRLSPTRVGSDDDWEYVSAGRFGTCGLKNGGEIHCWGDNWPPATDDTILTPKRMGSRTAMWKVDVGTGSACAIREDGALFCWGYSTHGEIGRGFTIDYTVPMQLGTETNYRDVAVGSDHACAIRGGEVWCWGSNEYGQLGVGSTGGEDSLEPVVVRTDGGWESIHAQGHHTCALRDGGRLYCWGENRSGEAGRGDDAVTEPRELCVTDWDA